MVENIIDINLEMPLLKTKKITKNSALDNQLSNKYSKNTDSILTTSSISPSDHYNKPTFEHSFCSNESQKTETPSVKLLNEILIDAAVKKASDIHFECLENDWRIRFRIDGKLHEMLRPPLHLYQSVMTRIKVLAKLDIAEKRIPQDGRLKMVIHHQLTEHFRVNSLPTVLGEKLVLRRLEKLPINLPLAALGYSEKQIPFIKEAIEATNGMILITGPTGSGKTLSLYSLLQKLNHESVNICTVEDPAEIQLPGIYQVNVREKAGLTFATALRAFLRQDPDIIMIGEIRDLETADVAIKAAQTGHLVLSTLHTNDAPSTLSRLLHIGVAPFNLASSIRLITAQRLLRKLCIHCRQPIEMSQSLLIQAGFKEDECNSPWLVYRAIGCVHCHGIGYAGRIGIHQILCMSEAMREIIVSGGNHLMLKKQAILEGMQTLRETALEKVREGIISLEEALAMTEGNEK